ncbi:methyltransferase domain-containing protein [Methylocaldum sp.]|uniref:methyltransferase domain-containing protein n=1 Tax=Methylocaldum sp. TaxID=1969727 RepID=UPI002D3E9E9F|nr:methyltransferase domain-containing protein [Methylocaldum sp.]HYE35734.1 methyltransferase domain-containing protein [Methylocaldum sp.]
MIYRIDRLIEDTARRYRAAGRFTEGFVRGKLRHDPVYAYLLSNPAWLPRTGPVLDLGCGRGILMSLLSEARKLALTPFGDMCLKGIELRPNDAAAARLALGDDAEIMIADVRTAPLPECGTVVLLDLLFYLGGEDQDRLLKRIAEILPGDGVLVMREPDAGAGLRFQATRAAERLCALARGHFRQRHHYRSETEWRGLLEAFGFSVETVSMSEGTPFANVLFIARLRIAS